VWLLWPHCLYFLKEGSDIDKVILYTDGASRGNPGPAAIGAILKDTKGNLLGRISQSIGSTTNNQAEYRAVIAALKKAISLGAGEVELRADSELVVKQINGKYRVKNAALRPLYQEVVKLIGSLDNFKAVSIPRAQNSEADSLANMSFKRTSEEP
jgi:ribonuclease HI